MNYLLIMAVLAAVLFVTQFYFSRKFSRSIKNLFPKLNPERFKLWRRIFLIYINLYPLLALLAWVYTLIANVENISPPENILFDYIILYPFWAWIILVIQTLLYFLVIDIIKFITFPFWKSIRERIRRVEAIIIFAIICFFALYVPARIFYDHNSVETREVKYFKENLHPDLVGFKIGFIADIHADYYTGDSRLYNFISRLNSANPDIVLIAGDIITRTPDYISKGAMYLGKIKSRYGVYSCVGDHDNWAYRNDYKRSLDEIKTALMKENVPMIDNDKLNLMIGGARLGITFVTNTYVERIDDAVLDSLTDGDPNKDFKIFLTHQPRQYLIDAAVKNKFNLYLAGHTHGGQITFLFPFLNPTITHIETRYVKGDFYFDDLMMVINRGLGMSLAQIRYNSRPEITLITLTDKND